MPTLTFPIPKDELRVDVRINLDAGSLAAILAAGSPAPSSLPTKGQIDTGSNVAGISATILAGMNASYVRDTSTQGLGGGISVRIFRVSLSIVDHNRPLSPWFTHPDLEVMELPATNDLDVLVGMDLMLGCRMIVDGPARQLTIDF